MRLLVLRGGALGDFIVTLPALGLLRAHWPAARIELVGHARAAELAVGRHYLDAAHSQHEARWAALYAPAPLPREFAAWLGAFDLIVSYWPDPENELRAHLAAAARRVILGGDQAATAPAAAHFCAPLSVLGLSTADYRSRVRLAPGDHAAAQRLLPAGAAPLVALHPGSGAPRKNWPLDRWIEVGRRLQDKHGAHLLLCGGEADAALREPLARAFAGTAHQLAWERPLPVLAGLLARCRLFLGHDTGVSHLAAAVDTACVLLFGPTDPAVWAPPGAHVLRHGAALDAIPAAAVMQAAENALT